MGPFGGYNYISPPPFPFKFQLRDSLSVLFAREKLGGCFCPSVGSRSRSFITIKGISHGWSSCGRSLHLPARLPLLFSSFLWLVLFGHCQIEDNPYSSQPLVAFLSRRWQHRHHVVLNSLSFFQSQSLLDLTASTFFLPTSAQFVLSAVPLLS